MNFQTLHGFEKPPWSKDMRIAWEVQRATTMCFFDFGIGWSRNSDNEGPLFVHAWPLPLASLARELPDLPGYADRLELYVDGLELANGFGELTDPAEQRRRFESDLKNRTASGRAAVPLDKAFLDSLEEAMPPAAGMALGIERLLMWLSGTQDIREVLAFAWGER